MKKGKKVVPTGTFYPPSAALKSFYNTSVVNQNVDIKLNLQNFANFKPVFTKHMAID